MNTTRKNHFAAAKARTGAPVLTRTAALLLWLSGTVLGVAQAAPTLQLPTSQFGVAETAGAVSLPVWRLNEATAAVSVDYATFDGSAKAGTNYTATNGTLAFAAGETNKLIIVPILDDATAEGSLYFRVVLSVLLR